MNKLKNRTRHFITENIIFGKKGNAILLLFAPLIITILLFSLAVMSVSYYHIENTDYCIGFKENMF